MKEKKLNDADIAMMFKAAKIKKCPSDESIASLADGSAGQRHRERIQTHCNDCPACRELLNDLKLLFAAVPREPSQALKQRLDTIMEARQTKDIDLGLSLAQYGLQVIKSLLSPTPVPGFAVRDKGGTAQARSFIVKAAKAKWHLEFHRGRGRVVDMLTTAAKMPEDRVNVSLRSGSKTLKSYSYNGKSLSFNNLKPGRYQLQWQGETVKNINFIIEG
jgi:hypothetical protein